MKKTGVIIYLILCAFIVTSCGSSDKKEPQKGSVKTDAQTNELPQRIISLNGAITAIVSDLGMERQIVGRDVTSTYPAYVRDSVRVLGHVSSISMEAVLALKPTLILAADNMMDSKLEEKIKASNVSYKKFHRDFSIQGTKALIKAIAGLTGSDKSDELISQIDSELAKITPISTPPKVLFIYARGTGNMMVGGKNTPVSKLIEIAGGVNAVTNVENYKPLTPEALLNSDPDILLLFDSSIEGLGGIDGILDVPGIAQTTAGKNKAIITMDGGLLANFSSRVGTAAVQLNRLLLEHAK